VGEDMIISGKVNVFNVPQGLQPQVYMVNDSLIDFTLTGEAGQHNKENNVDNVSIIFRENAFNAPIESIRFTGEYDIKIVYNDISGLEDERSHHVHNIVTQNPVKNYILINDELAVEGNTYYMIVDLAGKIICRGKIQYNKIDISAFSPGLYLLQICVKNKSFTEKIIVE
jgi:hypothetical protein